MDDLSGRPFGPYTIVEPIGEGGMAVVYKGYQQSLNRYVAVKVLRKELTRDRKFVLRFRREARAVARLRHPNILPVHDAGVVHGLHYIVMDYAEGGSLKDLVKKGPLQVERALSIVVQMADALDYAHRQGIVHRDVKPANILLTREGRPLLSDFGIAKALGQAGQLTQTGARIGTPAYMSPEQIDGKGADGRADIYALGIVLYEMLAGRVPFRASAPMAVLYKQLNEPPPPLRQWNAHAPPWLEAVVNKALAKRPAERYQRAGELAQALRQRRSPVRVVAPPPQVRRPPAPAAPKRATRPRRRASPIPILLGIAVVLCLALAGMGGYLWLRDRETGTPPTPLSAATSTPLPVSSPLAQDGPGTPTRPPVSSPLAQDEPGTPTWTPIVVVASDTPPPSGPTPTSPPAPSPTPRPPTPTREPGAITDFETFGVWKRGDQPNGTFTQSSAQVRQGSYAGKLDYHFDTAGNDYIVFRQSHALSGQPTRLTAWVYGDGSGHFFNIWIKDKGGQVWQVPLGRVTHTGWQQMTGTLDVNQGWPWAHISGPDNGQIDYPVSFYALVLDDYPDSFIGSGVIYLDDLRADG